MLPCIIGHEPEGELDLEEYLEHLPDTAQCLYGAHGLGYHKPVLGQQAGLQLIHHLEQCQVKVQVHLAIWPPPADKHLQQLGQVLAGGGGREA